MIKAKYLGSQNEFLETGKVYGLEISYDKIGGFRVRIYDKTRVLFKWLPHKEYANKTEFLTDWSYDV